MPLIAGCRDMEGKTTFLKKPAAGAARIWILYRIEYLLEYVHIFRKGGSVRNYCDVCEIINHEKVSPKSVGI